MTIPYVRQGDTIIFGSDSGQKTVLVLGTCPQCGSSLVPNLTPDPKAPSMKCINCAYMGN